MDVRVRTDKCTRGAAVGGVRAVGEAADYSIEPHAANLLSVRQGQGLQDR